MEALISKASVLSANVVDNYNGGTEITVLADKEVVGKATLGGKYNKEQAMREFKKNPGKFTKGQPLDYVPLLKQLKLI